MALLVRTTTSPHWNGALGISGAIPRRTSCYLNAMLTEAMLTEALDLISSCFTGSTVRFAAFDYPSEKEAAPLMRRLSQMQQPYRTYKATGALLGDQVRWNKTVLWIGPDIGHAFEAYPDRVSA